MKIYIQSISDIITNSSSEVFCRITSENNLNEIYEFLKEIFPQDDYEMDIVIDYYDPADEPYIDIDIPYHMEGICTLLEHGLSPMLQDKFPNSEFKIKYNDLY